MNNKIVIDAIKAKEALVNDVASKIWEYAELSLHEERSCELYVDILKKEGFTVTKKLCDIPTAFLAEYGSGRPIIGILAEYDALSSLSQKAGASSKQPLTEGGNGHGCGHNLLGAGALAAALGIKAYLETRPGMGTVRLYGCPGEEGWASKSYMAREKVWEELDCALTWHPEDCNEVVTGSTNSCIQTLYTFNGVASHASGAPHMGRSALDALELMNIGVQFLREHMTDDCRIHYSIIDGGGVSPNVVQQKASVLYMVRANHVAEAVKLQERVDRVADGACLMTDTTVKKQFVDGLADTITNRTLEKVLYDNFKELGVPSYTEKERLLADEIEKTIDTAGYVPGLGSSVSREYARSVEALRKECDSAMNSFLLPHFEGNVFRAGSTDVGDVSHLCPTAQIHVAAWPNGAPGHSWQNVSCAGMSIGQKAAVHAGKVIACAAVDLYENAEILHEAKREFEISSMQGYICPFPDDARPEIPDEL